MNLLFCINLIWLVPCSWIACLVTRKKSFDERWMYLHRWCLRMFRFMHVRLEVEMVEPLREDISYQFVSNHQSFFDLFMLAGGLPVPFTFVSKKENQKVPYIASWSKNLELIYFDREDQSSAIHMLRETTRRLKSGQNVLIFPEGTRSADNHMNEMHAGSIQPAFMAKCAIVPIVLKNSYNYKHLLRTGTPFKMYIGKPIPFEEFKPFKADGMIDVLQKQMEAELEK